MAAQFARIPELLNLLGELNQDVQTADGLALSISQPLGKKLRYTLCLVSRLFHEAFAPGLYRSLEWDGNNYSILLDDEKRAHFLKIPHLTGHTQSLVFTAEACDAAARHQGPLYSVREIFIHLHVCNAILEVIRKTPNLQKFICHNIIVTNELVAYLSGLENLETLEIQFPTETDCFLGYNTRFSDNDAEFTHMHETRFPIFGHPWELFSSFRHLRDLSIQGLSGNIHRWRAALVDIFVSNPHLEHFGTSMDDATMERLFQHDINRDYKRTFLESVFDDYGRRLNESQQPHKLPLLRLRTLRVGKWMSLPSLSVLQEAMDLECLERLHIFNNTGPLEEYTIPWATLTAKSMPGLRYFSFELLSEGSLQGLLSLIGPSHTGPPISCLRIHGSVVPKSMGKLLESLATTATMLHLPYAAHSYGRPETRRFLEEARYLTHLSIDITFWDDPETSNHDDLFWGGLEQVCRSLGGLPLLQAVWIWGMEPWSRKNRFTLQDYESSVREVANACHRLRYIRCEGWSWRVQRARSVQVGQLSIPEESNMVNITLLNEEEDKDVAPEFFGMFPEVRVVEESGCQFAFFD